MIYGCRAFADLYCWACIMWLSRAWPFGGERNHPPPPLLLPSILFVLPHPPLYFTTSPPFHLHHTDWKPLKDGWKPVYTVWPPPPAPPEHADTYIILFISFSTEHFIVSVFWSTCRGGPDNSGDGTCLQTCANSILKQSEVIHWRLSTDSQT